MKEIGGFFELELDKKEEYHKEAIKLNTARNSLEYILRLNNYKKIYLPYYICSSVLEPINKLGLKHEFYNINDDFNYKFDLSKLNNDELFLYVNYFGICNKIVDKLLEEKKRIGFDLCIDNTQAFFTYPKGENYTIYSARKFFGVPDGAYLYTNKTLNYKIDREIGYDKVNHLLKRIEVGPNEAYLDFKENSKKHSNTKIKSMSKLSERILSSIDYNKCMNIRGDNFNYLHSHLKKYNILKIDLDNIQGPMVYPLLVNQDIREYLIENNIYVAQYWSEVLKNVDEKSTEYNFTKRLIALPIDQRYSLEDMNYIIQKIKSFYNKSNK